MSFAKQLFYRAVRLTPLSLLQRSAARPLLLPYHHLVSDREVPYISPIYPFKNRRQFGQDLDYLLRHFTPVTLADTIAAVRGGKPLPQNAFLLSFDDGLREIAEVVAPMLTARGIPAVFFLNPAYLGNKTPFYRFTLGLLLGALRSGQVSPGGKKAAAALLGVEESALEGAIQRVGWQNRALADRLAEVMAVDANAIFWRERPYMEESEVEGLVRAGFSLGGHSMEHPYYQELSVDEQVRQTMESVDAVCGRFGLKERVFAFPHTDAGVTRAFFDRVLEGPGALDLVFGTANHRADVDPRILQRFNCERPGVRIDDGVKGILLLEALRMAAGRNLVTRS